MTRTNKSKLSFIDFILQIDVNQLFSKIYSLDSTEKQLKSLEDLILKFIDSLRALYHNRYEHMTWSAITMLMKETDNLMTRYEILVDIIDQKHICKNLECSIYEPLSYCWDLLDKMEYYTLKEINDNITNYYDRIDAIREYGKCKSKLNDVFKDIKAMSDVYGTVRYDESLKHDHFRKDITLGKWASEMKIMNIRYIGNLENFLIEQSEDLYGPVSEETENEEDVNTEEQVKRYITEGKHNEKRIEEQFGKDLNKIRRVN